jgi:hypothetical protein
MSGGSCKPLVDGWPGRGTEGSIDNDGSVDGVFEPQATTRREHAAMIRNRKGTMPA